MNNLEQIEKNYQIVVIDSFYNLRNNQEIINFLPKIFKFKIKGYLEEYPNGVLPFDSSDFVATHLLLCAKNQGVELTPVLGFKSVTLERCNKHRLTFPMLDMLKSSEDTSSHYKVVRRILSSYEMKKKPSQIAYNGSFTISPHLRKEKDLMKHLWEITFSMLNNYYITKNIERVLALCATKYNVHKKKEQLGWNYIHTNDTILNQYKCQSLYEANLIPMEFTNIKEKNQLLPQRFKRMWEKRLEYTYKEYQYTKKSA